VRQVTAIQNIINRELRISACNRSASAKWNLAIVFTPEEQCGLTD
jgi:hypothetical protein